MRRRLLAALLLAGTVFPAGAGAVAHQLGAQRIVYHGDGRVVVSGQVRGPGTFAWTFDPATTSGPAIACTPAVYPGDAGPTPCSPCLHSEAQPIYTLAGGEVTVTRTFRRRGRHRFRVAVRLRPLGAVFVSSESFPALSWGPPNDPQRFSCHDEVGATR